MVSETETSAIGNALVVLGAAGIVIPAFARFRLPPVIGFILVGLLVGPSGLGALAADYPWLKHVTIGSTEDIALFGELRSEERRVGTEWFSSCRSRWSPNH